MGFQHIQYVATRSPMQDDGNLVIYGDKKESGESFPPFGPGAGRDPLWASNTSGKPGAFLVIQDAQCRGLLAEFPSMGLGKTRQG